MGLFRRMRAALYRWRIARIDRRLDALQATRQGQTDRADARHLGLEFDSLAIGRAVLARRLGRLSEGADAQVSPRERQAPVHAELVDRYVDLDRELVETRDSQVDPVQVDRLAQELAATQHEIETGRPQRAP
jgi:hypothetical protein